MVELLLVVASLRRGHMQKLAVTKGGEEHSGGGNPRRKKEEMGER